MHVTHINVFQEKQAKEETIKSQAEEIERLKAELEETRNKTSSK